MVAEILEEKEGEVQEEQEGGGGGGGGRRRRRRRSRSRRSERETRETRHFFKLRKQRESVFDGAKGGDGLLEIVEIGCVERRRLLD